MISVYYWNHLLELCCPFRFIWGVAVFLNWNCSRVLTLVHYQDLFLKVIFYPSNNLSKWIYALIFFTLSCEAKGIIKWIKYKILFFVTSRSIVFDLTKKKNQTPQLFLTCVKCCMWTVNLRLFSLLVLWGTSSSKIQNCKELSISPFTFSSHITAFFSP